MATQTCPNCAIPDWWPRFTDPEWERLAPLLPRGDGLQSESTRRHVDGMRYMLEAGSAWKLLPTQYGPYELVATRFRRWAADGVFRRAYHELYPPRQLADGRLVVADGSYCKAHRAASGARVDVPAPRCDLWCLQEGCPPKRYWDCPRRQAMGMTRGGRNTNVVILVNDERQLVTWTLLPGHAPESKAIPILLKGLLPSVVVADDVHDNNLTRRMLEARGIDGAIPNHPRRTRNPYPRHPMIRKQHLADNYFADLKAFRRVATRYEKTAAAFDEVVALAALVIALRRDCQEPRLPSVRPRGTEGSR